MAKGKTTAQDSTPAPGQEGHGKQAVNKTEAVKQALAKMGAAASLKGIQEFVGTEFGLPISISHISNIKSTLHKKKRGPKGKPGRKPSVAVATVVLAPVVPAGNGVAARRNGQHHDGIGLEDIIAAKQLALKVGVKELHTLIDLVAE